MPGHTLIPWAVFDATWYQSVYQPPAAADPAASLAYYLEVGQRLGHSPNRMFDETWHRATYPTIADGVASGAFASAFDAYCRRGCLDRSAHWLFDELAYRDRYRDLTDDVLAEAEVANGYDHYLRHGAKEDRVGHLLFDAAIYLANFDRLDIATIRAAGVFQHYLNRIESAEPELRTSAYFDPAWYRRRYPEVAQAIAAGRWKSALHHYLCNDTATAFDPSEYFSEAYYLQRDPGLIDVIASGHFHNGYAHFLQFGARELRAPAAFIDLSWYADQPAVRAEIEQGLADGAFAHWLTIGAPARMLSAKPAPQQVTPPQARALWHQTAAAQLPIAGRFGYRFTCSIEPIVSVIITVRDGFAMTMATIASVRANTAAEIELIVIDRGSTDETRSIAHYVPGAKVLRFEDDIGWSRAMDAGRQLASSAAVLFLSCAAQLAQGSIERACIRLANHESAGAVGGLIVQPNGVIAQAGGILWNDGGTHDYQRGASPLAPEANFVRRVDFCSPAFLLVRADLLGQLNGFDHACAAGYEATDLCLRIAAAGFSVLYDPSVLLWHDDLAAVAAATAVAPDEHFVQKHQALLADRPARGGAVQIRARQIGQVEGRILFIDDTIPLRHTGSGFVRSNDLIKVMAGLGYAVTVFPVDGCGHDLARVYGDMPDTAEVMHSLTVDRLKELLVGRAGYYDTIWVARVHNLDRIRPILLPLIASGVLRAKIVLDTEAVTPHRDAMLADLTVTTYDLEAGMLAFTAVAGICQTVIAVTQVEAAILRQHGLTNVTVVGHMMEPRPTPRPFAQRTGLLFVGAIHKHDSPNLDSLNWFVDEVLPMIEAALSWQTRLTIAGYVAPDVDLGRFEHHPRITLRGAVADLEPLYDAHRVFIAPTRYAAGAPYKVLEAASFGLPVAATQLLLQQLDWTDQEMLAAPADDPAAFASNILKLYHDEATWRHVRDGALGRLQSDHAADDYALAVGRALRA